MKLREREKSRNTVRRIILPDRRPYGWIDFGAGEESTKA